MHGVYKCCYIFRRSVLADAVAEIENVRRTDLVRIVRRCLVGRSEALQGALHLGPQPLQLRPII